MRSLAHDSGNRGPDLTHTGTSRKQVGIDAANENRNPAADLSGRTVKTASDKIGKRTQDRNWRPAT
jgi:hypothetical protein